MTKKELIIYEGAMCCSTGVCGPEPDKRLIEFSETVKRLQKEYTNLEIKRASITFNLNMFLEDKDVFQMVKEKGQDILPIITLNRKIIAKQKYLKYDELKKVLESESK
ncbi:MAG: arsenite efflux transporter metallochaperone ArsD [Nanoarchaeota archaeon]